MRPANVGFAGPTGEPTVTLTWEAPNAGQPKIDGYLVQYRPLTDTVWMNKPGPIDGLHYKFTDLTPNNTYAFRVAAIGDGKIGEWLKAEAVAPVRAHYPRYSDLIIWNGRNEVDVTLIQMLLFTVIAAGFVLLQIWRDNAIPEIPQGILILIGISNGVYLTAKFIPPQR